MKKNHTLVLFSITIVIALISTIGIFWVKTSSYTTGGSTTQVGKATVKFRDVISPPLVVPPVVGQGGGTGGGGQGQGCCYNATYDGVEYWCNCTTEYHGTVLRQPIVCCVNPVHPACYDFCVPRAAQVRPEFAFPTGACPRELRCGQLCCEEGEICYNDRCTMPIPSELLPEPEFQLPELPYYYSGLPSETKPMPWWPILIGLAILIALVYFLRRKKKPESHIKQRKKR